MGATAGYFCLLSCGVGCRVVLSGHGCLLLGVGGVGRGVRRVRKERAVVERSGPRGAGVAFLVRGGCDVNGFARSVLHDPGRLEELKDSYVAPRGAQVRTWILVRLACARVREARGFWA